VTLIIVVVILHKQVNFVTLIIVVVIFHRAYLD